MKREPWTKERLLELLHLSEVDKVKHKQLAAANGNISIPRISQLLAKARKMQETVEA